MSGTIGTRVLPAGKPEPNIGGNHGSWDSAVSTRRSNSDHHSSRYLLSLDNGVGARRLNGRPTDDAEAVFYVRSPTRLPAVAPWKPQRHGCCNAVSAYRRVCCGRMCHTQLPRPRAAFLWMSGERDGVHCPWSPHGARNHIHSRTRNTKSGH